MTNEFNPIMDEKIILVVDDSSITRGLIEHIYKDKYKVMMASDGKQAMDIVDVMPEGTIMAILLKPFSVKQIEDVVTKAIELRKNS